MWNRGGAVGLHHFNQGFIRADGGVIDRDAGLFLKGLEETFGQIVRPHQNVQLAG